MEATLKRYSSAMTVEVALRDLRNHTSDLLQRVESGEELVITKRGKPVARLMPVAQKRRRPIPREEMAERLRSAQADPGLRDDLRELAGEMTDEDGLDELWRGDS